MDYIDYEHTQLIDFSLQGTQSNLKTLGHKVKCCYAECRDAEFCDIELHNTIGNDIFVQKETCKFN